MFLKGLINQIRLFTCKSICPGKVFQIPTLSATVGNQWKNRFIFQFQVMGPAIHDRITGCPKNGSRFKDLLIHILFPVEKKSSIHTPTAFWTLQSLTHGVQELSIWIGSPQRRHRVQLIRSHRVNPRNHTEHRGSIEYFSFCKI